MVCTAEGRCLITLDKDFSDPVRYPPRQFAGIVVVRLPGRSQLPLLERALALVVEAAKKSEVNTARGVAVASRGEESFIVATS